MSKLIATVTSVVLSLGLAAVLPGQPPPGGGPIPKAKGKGRGEEKRRARAGR